MRRLAPFTALLSLFTPALLALPVSSPHVNRPTPVPTRQHGFAVGVLGHPTPLAGGGALLASTPAASVAGFTTVGATWSRGSLAPGQRIELRTRTRGTWSGWSALEVTDVGADEGGKDARAARLAGARDVAEPVWVGPSDGVQARVRSLPGTAAAAAPGNLSLVLVDGGSSAADASPEGSVSRGSAAVAATAQPAVYSRAQWGADESLRGRNGASCLSPSYSATIQVGFVHHTDTPNDYAPADVPSVLRGIYAYHVLTNGWCDIGYNFLIDRFGRTWEGRYGGIDKPVIGAHTGGFNRNSFAASLIGTFSSNAPSPAMLDAVRRLYAWKLAMHHADPDAFATLTSAGGGTSRYPAGVAHTFRVLSGHRDAGYTTCPGDAAYADLPGIRTQVRNTMAAGFVLPAAAMTAAGSQVTSGQLIPVTWALTATSSTGAVVRVLRGSSVRSVSTTWDWKDSTGTPVEGGVYRLTLTGAHSGYTAVPWSATVQVPSVARLGAATRGSGDTDLVERTGAGPLSYRLLTDRGLSEASALPSGTVGSSSVASRGPGAATVVALGSAGTLLVSEQAPDGSWPQWTSLPGALTSRPAVAAAQGGALNVVARGADGSLLHRWSTSAGTWSPWSSLGGSLAGHAGPALTRTADGRLVVVAVRADLGTESRTWARSTGWGPWRDLGGRTGDDLAIVAPATGDLVIASRGTNGLAYVRTLGTTSRWASLGGGTYAGPAAATSAGQPRVLLTGLNGLPYENVRTGAGWSGWQHVG